MPNRTKQPFERPGLVRFGQRRLNPDRQDRHRDQNESAPKSFANFHSLSNAKCLRLDRAAISPNLRLTTPMFLGRQPARFSSSLRRSADKPRPNSHLLNNREAPLDRADAGDSFPPPAFAQQAS